jgi:formylglycine-generating enzyme required for sulfatase activity
MIKFAKALMTPPTGVMVLASCAPGQVSLEDDDLQHGVFMHFLVKGLAGAADERGEELQGNGNGRVSLSELFDYASQQTELFVKRRRVVQTPQLWGKRTGVFEFGEFDGKPVAPRRLTNSIGMELAWIPAGEFQMGSRVPAAETAKQFQTVASHFVSEHPLHPVRITQAFYLGVHEVTIGQFRLFVDSQGHITQAEAEGRGGIGWDEKWRKGREFSWRYGGWKVTDNHPVANVSWNDAVAFCGWLSRKEGRSYRLPTEAEWEYACRANTDTLFYHGDNVEDLVKFGNVPDADAKQKLQNPRSVRSRDGYAFSAPVGQYEANAFGIHDMHGNVWEWCWDAYSETYYATFLPEVATDPKGPDPVGTATRVLRGGSWSDHPLLCRSAARKEYEKTGFLYNYGFRVVCEVPQHERKNDERKR